MRISMGNGIEIEPFKIGWLQLIAIAAFLGGYGVTLKTVVDNQAKSTKATTELTDTMNKINLTLTEMGGESRHLGAEVMEMKSRVHSVEAKNISQDAHILELQIITGIKK